MGLRIRVKLLLAFGSILLLSVLLIIFSVYAVQRILLFKGLNEKADHLAWHMASINLATTEFIYEGYRAKAFQEDQSSPAVHSFLQHYEDASAIIRDIKQSDTGQENLTSQLQAKLDSLRDNFQHLVELLKHRGFKDYGLEGSLRQAIHNVENSGLDFDKVTMLMLRRHEKDFFLRKDLRYRDEFNNRMNAFRENLKTQDAASPLLTFLDNYQQEFNKVVDIELAIGLKENEGIRGRLHNIFQSIRPQLDNFRSDVKAQNEKQIQQTLVVLLIIFAVQIISGLLLAVVYANLLTNAIKEIRTAMQKLAEGVFPDKLSIKTTEEIGQTKIAFNSFIDRLQVATQFAAQLGGGKLQAEYDARYANDVLAQAIISMQQKLREAEAHQQRINWTNEGAARFNDILKKGGDHIETVAHEILNLLIHYIGANQGALYIRETDADNDDLVRVATYAYSKKKMIDQRIRVGSGLVGQCVLEKSLVYLKDVPRDYVTITSGLGEATPRNVMIIPLQYQQMVMGVVELASFRQFENHEINFVEKMSESMATLLSNKQQNERTQRLLAESEARAKALIQQEEAMRQNAEELVATQEALELQREDMRREIEELQRKLNQYKMEAVVL